VAGARRCLVLFQPHRYSRTQHLWDEFCRCFLQADVLLLTDVYAAGEEPLENVSARALAEAIEGKGHRQVRYAGDLKAAMDALAAEAREGDVVLTLGAGNVWTAGEELLRRRGR
jgi:UDP-N-acetylmuramate--alanine ligase